MSMNLKNKTVLITGASSGIGRAAAEQFAAQGCRLIITARRLLRLEALSAKLQSEQGVDVLPLALDIQDKVAVKSTIESLSPDWSSIDVLVNNAGLALGSELFQNGNVDDWDRVIQTNVNGLLYVTRAVLPGMLKRQNGHIINVGSIAGREYYPTGNVYSASKHAVKAISKSLRLDLLGTPLRVSEVAPGAVNTEFSEVRWNDKTKADAFYEGFDALSGDDIADAIVYCATRPAHVDVAEIAVFPTSQASANHLHKGETVGGIFD
mgnify:CR=1 FL=1|jgi:3-hydroxy acid dehydrogenase / malonic semialdehyde reductase